VEVVTPDPEAFKDGLKEGRTTTFTWA